MSVIIDKYDGFPYFINWENKYCDYSGSILQLIVYEPITRNGQQINDFRRCIIYGTKSELDYFIHVNIERGSEIALKGRIVVKEFLESSVPENYKARLDQNKPWEEAVNYKLLQDYKTTSYLTFKGERILRFFDYDSTGDEKDVIIENTDIASNNKTITSIPSVDSVNVQSESKTVPENTFRKTNVSPTLNTKTVSKPEVKSNSGQTNDNNSNHQRKSHTTSNVLFVIGLLTIVFFAFMFKNITMIIVGAAIVGFLSYLIGGIVQGPTKSTSFGSTIITIVIGIIAIIVISYAFGGCGGSEPDSGWRRP
jgi:hypothetical protein